MRRQVHADHRHPNPLRQFHVHQRQRDRDPRPPREYLVEAGVPRVVELLRVTLELQRVEHVPADGLERPQREPVLGRR